MNQISKQADVGGADTIINPSDRTWIDTPTGARPRGAYPSAIHYGPVWNKKREIGETFAACDGDTESYATLTTHTPWVTCPDCKAILSSSSTNPNQE